MKHLLRQRLALIGILGLAFASTAEKCGPATGLQPAYVAGSVVADDSITGEYTIVESKNPLSKATIKREDTVDGPSYVLTTPAEKARFRIFLFDIGGQRFADVIAERFKPEKDDLTLELDLPGHMYCTLQAAAGGPAG